VFGVYAFGQPYFAEAPVLVTVEIPLNAIEAFGSYDAYVEAMGEYEPTVDAFGSKGEV